MLEPSRFPCNPLLGKEMYSNEEALKSSSGSAPLRSLCPALSTLSSEQLPRPTGMRPLNRFLLRSSTAKDAELMQKEDGIHPWKLLLLASSTTRLFITFHVADGNSPVKRLLEMFSTCNCNGRPPVAEDGVSSRSSPSRRLKLTSTATKPLEEDRSFSNGSSPDSELRERLRRRSPARSPRAGETGPWSPLPGRETSTTAPSPSQATPSHEQHPAVALLRRHDVARPPSRDSPTTNRSRSSSPGRRTASHVRP
ncbi:hypothetical protein PVAP13_1KG055431 [Panicum virgatum]|uniref:Uncharacterized protein n=1 Tax=Panicum virgatum TaxID=38727 RepID=A0A8T0X307_PANVG|nr:hypothetical protein PVAP13_1KG055431 [Panicum virgatum]